MYKFLIHTRSKFFTIKCILPTIPISTTKYKYVFYSVDCKWHGVLLLVQDTFSTILLPIRAVKGNVTKSTILVRVLDI